MRALLLLLAACGGATAARPTGPKAVALAGDTITLETRGQGPLCVAIAGGPGLDSQYLRDAELEKLATIVYVDLAGTGASSKRAEYSIAHDVETIEALRVHLGQDKLCVIAHSYGGFAALRWASEHPSHVGRLVLYSTTPTTSDDWSKLIEGNLAAFKDQPWFGDAMRGFELDEKATTQAELDEALRLILPLYFAKWDERYRPLVTRSRLVYDVYKRRTPGAYDVRAKLAAITAPTLVIAGKHDFLCGVVPSTWIAQGIPGAKLVVIDDVGHFAHLERSGAFIAAIRAFVK